MVKISRIKFWFSWIFRILLVIALGLAIYKFQWLNVMLALSGLFLTFIPSIIAKSFKIHYPNEFELVFLLFVFLSIFLGEIYAFYVMFWWWDVFLHTLSGIIIADFAFSLVYILNQEKKVMMSPSFVALFSFNFAVAMGAIWEIFEFSLDYFFGFTTQGIGIFDTMADLIVDSLGALFISILGFIYLRKQKKLFDRWDKDLIELNKDYFRKSFRKRFYLK